MTTAKKSDAYLKAEFIRANLHPGAERIENPDLTATVYLYTNRAGKPCYAGYKGRSTKPCAQYYYPTTDKRDAAAKAFLESFLGRNTKPEAKAVALQVGDVLRSMWGYDQTNVDYFKVTRLVGTRSVELVEIGKLVADTGRDDGECAPDVSREIGERFIRRVRSSGQSVRIDEVRSAHKVEPKMIAGAAIYGADSWTGGR